MRMTTQSRLVLAPSPRRTSSPVKGRECALARTSTIFGISGPPQRLSPFSLSSFSHLAAWAAIALNESLTRERSGLQFFQSLHGSDLAVTRTARIGSETDLPSCSLLAGRSLRRFWFPRALWAAPVHTAERLKIVRRGRQ